jgi:diguanylate cyclase (GGDEF)-like protein
MSEAAVARRTTFRDVLAVREFKALYVAQTLSVAGDQLARIAVAVIVFSRTGSTFLTGLSYAASYLPWLIGGPLLAGFADRKPRRQVMIACDLVRACLVATMAISACPTPLLIVLVGLTTLCEPPFASAQSSVIPDVVGEGDAYNTASTLVNTSNQLSVVAGFAGGGALVAIAGAHLTLVLDAVTFACSGLLASRFLEARPAVIVEPTSWTRELREGASVVFRDPRLRWLVVTTWLVLGAAVSTESAAVPFATSHAAGSTTAGLLIASLPLGMVVGALVLGRLIPLATSERLMLPLALLAPATLGLTAFDSPPRLTGVIWFVSGLFAAMTVTANRVFMVSIRREVRGRAFGIAVTGIVVSQGLYSLLTGALATYFGPAHAVADLALPSLALIVCFAASSFGYRSSPPKPIKDISDADDEEHPMPVRPRRPEARAWLLNLALIASVAIASPSVRGDRAYASIHLPAWWLFAVLAVGQAYSLSFSIRNQSFQVVLETVPLVLGLFFVSPLELIALRVAAVLLVDLLIDRLPIVKAVFNVASIGLATLVATQILRAMASAHDGLHPAAWPATFGAVVASEVICGLLVLAVLRMTGARAQIPEASRVVGVGILVSVVMTFFALVTAAALEYDLSAAWAISVFVVLALTAAQTYYRLIERTAALDRLYVVARELGPIASEPSDLAPALMQLRQVMRARSLELAVAGTATRDFATVISVSLSDHADRDAVEERTLHDGLDQLVANRPREGRWAALLRPTSALRREPDRISAAVSTDDRTIGVLTAINGPDQKAQFDRSDLRLLEAAADQLAAALEKGRLVESLRRAATLDTLTGLANLDSFRSFLDTSLDGTAGGVLILLNLDRFREVNDMLGHEAGDAVLAEVARRLVSAPTQGSLVARVGGDQFAIAIPGSAGSEVARLAAMAVKSRVDGSIRFAEVSADVRVTIGIARAPDHGNNAATLLRRAEMAMAAAKGGTSGIGEWEPDFERDGSRRLQILTGLRAALSDGSLRVDYQPKLRLGTGEVTGFEALVRWTHPEMGPISPGEFVPIAEATGLISALTSTVLRQALATCRAWHDAGKPVGVAVNVSARSLDDSVLVGQVAAMLTASGLEPQWLTLEITESSVMEDHLRSLEVLRDLRTLGARLSIDDFGTGYSSLHQLRGLPVHEVKIDRSFVDEVDSDEADRAVIRAVVELCDSLGLTTVAEGVEKASQAFALEALGVGYVQGYFHGRPMTADAAMEWLTHRKVASLTSI